MSRLVLLVVSVLLALLSIAHARSKEDQIRIYAFTSDYCFGPPHGANVDLERGECQNFDYGARSIRPVFDPKRSKWVNDVNNGGTHCELITYKTPGCLGDQELEVEELPAILSRCLHPGQPGENISIFSAKFQCGNKVISSQTSGTTYTTTIVATSWTFGANEKPTPNYETNILTLTHADRQNIAVRSPESSENRLEPRDKKGNTKGVWLYHPWSWSVICYECYTEKLDDYTEFECRSGPNNPVSCGARPVAIDGERITVTEHISTTLYSDSTTLYELTTSTVDIGDVEKLAPVPLEKRKSWHRRVTFDHPFVPGKRVCADAEWEKRGKPNAEVRLQKTGDKIEKCQKTAAQPIDLPGPVHETVLHTYTLPTSTATSTHTVYVFGPETGDEPNVLAHKDL